MSQVESSASLLASVRAPLRHHLQVAARVAGDLAVPLWMVGGAVRDLRLRRASRDVDLVVLGRWRHFTQELARRFGAKITWRRSLLTAGFTTHAGFEFDIVRARSEVYDSPGALPTVRPGTLYEDLYRRDFSVNAIALPLAIAGSEVTDPFGGSRDIARGRLRVLHDRSFIDDPDRLFRAIELSSRSGLRLEPRCAELAAEAVASDVLGLISADRLRRGFELIFSDAGAAARSIELLADLGIDGALHPRLVCGKHAGLCLRRLAAVDGEVPSKKRWLTCLLALGWELTSAETAEVLRRLGIDEKTIRELLARRAKARDVGDKLEALDSPYERFKLGDSLDPMARALAISCGRPAVRSFFGTEWEILQGRRPTITGRDLLALGFSAGAPIGRALEATLEARMAQQIGRLEERRFAATWLEKHEEQPTPDDAPVADPGERDERAPGGGS